MSRGLSATNQAEVDAAHLHEVVLVKFDFDTPVYVHSGIGTITYNSNDYLGVGHFGGIGIARESENLGPASLELTLSGVTTGYVTEALDAGNLYDKVTVYVGYRQDDGTLVDDPWVCWSGWYETDAISLDVESSVKITCQHDLAFLSEKAGDRYSDEDQQSKYSGDVGLEFTSAMSTTDLLWGGGPVIAGGGTGRSPYEDKRQDRF
jgi:hypothetical protein